MQIVRISDVAGSFAENKDAAREVRINRIMPRLANDEEIVLDFADITGATQSFVHALISEAIRQYGDRALDLIEFRNCAPLVREVVVTVCEYMQES